MILASFIHFNDFHTSQIKLILIHLRFVAAQFILLYLIPFKVISVSVINLHLEATCLLKLI